MELYYEKPTYEERCIFPSRGVICERVFIFILDAFTRYSTMTSFIYSLQSLWLEIVDRPASHGFPGPYHIMFDIKLIRSSRWLCFNEFRTTILKHHIALRLVKNLFRKTGVHRINPYIKTLGLSHKIIIRKRFSTRFAADTKPFTRHQCIVEMFCRNRINVDIYSAECV